jgi:hypothetical protein
LVKGEFKGFEGNLELLGALTGVLVKRWLIRDRTGLLRL